MSDQLINGFNFEEATDQVFLGFNFETLDPYPIIFGLCFEFDNNNFNCNIIDKLGNSVSNVTFNIINTLDNLTYTSDSNGFVEGLIRPGVKTTMLIMCNGYKNYSQDFILDTGDMITLFITLHKITHIISVNGNVLISHNPTNQDNQIFE